MSREERMKCLILVLLGAAYPIRYQNYCAKGYSIDKIVDQFKDDIEKIYDYNFVKLMIKDEQIHDKTDRTEH